MIHKLVETDFETIFHIINDAAMLYTGKIPTDCNKTPYMPKEELTEEIKAGVKFYGYIEDGTIVAVMGIQSMSDVTLIRHAYTLTSHQRRGIGKKLIKYLMSLAETDLILVGTWEDADGAIHFYQKTVLNFCQGKKQISFSVHTGIFHSDK